MVAGEENDIFSTAIIDFLRRVVDEGEHG
jgi:hypothetical protein